jgi:3-oxoacyl-[acyl-carrier protein] reductase
MRVLVTGTSRGLGLGLAQHLLQQGNLVVGCARSASPINDAGYTHVQADVTDEQAISALMNTIRDTVGGLDALVNNAGVARMLPLAITPVDTARRIMEVNFLGSFLLMHGALRLLRKSTSGRIVNLTSIAVPLRLEGEAVYASAKSAVEMLTRTAAKELGPMGVTCNAVGPAPVRTDLTSHVPEEKLAALIAHQSIRRWATPEDVFNVIDFFLKPESSMITGQVIYLGGIG